MESGDQLDGYELKRRRAGSAGEQRSEIAALGGSPAGGGGGMKALFPAQVDGGARDRVQGNRQVSRVELYKHDRAVERRKEAQGPTVLVGCASLVRQVLLNRDKLQVVVNRLVDQVADSTVRHNASCHMDRTNKMDHPHFVEVFRLTA